MPIEYNPDHFRTPRSLPHCGCAIERPVQRQSSGYKVWVLLLILLVLTLIGKAVAL